ncbi:MAG: hypothetical protein HUU15_04375 [Candidatus Brocadiae bacterium]|nr:hypothetical protein [Candidatus Brocadiia bacterium]
MSSRPASAAVLLLAALASADPPDAADPWAPVMPRLQTLAADGREALSEQELKALGNDLAAVQRGIADRHGVVLRDALLTPDGVARLLPALLGALKPAPAERDRAAVEQILAAQVERWNAVAVRTREMTPLERRAEFFEVWTGLHEDLDARLEIEVILRCRQVLLECKLAAGPARRITEANRSDAPAKLAELWMRELSLEAKHVEGVTAVAEAFCDDLERVTDAVDRKAAPAVLARQMLGPQIRAQKGLLALPLTDAERAAVRGWEANDLVVPAPLPPIVAPGDGRFGGGIRPGPKEKPATGEESEQNEDDHREGPAEPK